MSPFSNLTKLMNYKRKQINSKKKNNELAKLSKILLENKLDSYNKT